MFFHINVFQKKCQAFFCFLKSKYYLQNLIFHFCYFFCLKKRIVFFEYRLSPLNYLKNNKILFKNYPFGCIYSLHQFFIIFPQPLHINDPLFAMVFLCFCHFFKNETKKLFIKGLFLILCVRQVVEITMKSRRSFMLYS